MLDRNQVPKIETQNDISFNVFGYENKEAYPLYISKYNYPDKCGLLLLSKGELTHYVWIKDFNKFMYNKTKHKGKKHFCKSCFCTVSQKKEH